MIFRFLSNRYKESISKYYYINVYSFCYCLMKYWRCSQYHLYISHILQVTLTAFYTESTHFKLESLVKHRESAKHKKYRDKCVAKCPGSSGSIVKAFYRHDAHVCV